MLLFQSMRMAVMNLSILSFLTNRYNLNVLHYGYQEVQVGYIILYPANFKILMYVTKRNMSAFMLFVV